MERYIPVKLPMPKVIGHFSAFYSRVKKPTGIEYIILSIIQSKAYARDSWGEVMESMGITFDLFQNLFVPAIKEMEGNMIESSYRMEVTLDDAVNMYRLTSHGKDVFSKGYIAVQPESVQGAVAYCPGKPDDMKYRHTDKAKETPMEGLDASRFAEEKMDPGMMESCLTRNRRQFGILDNDADIFDFQIIGNEETVVYGQGINLEFDVSTGEFSIRDGEHDLRFIKNNYRAEDVIGVISENYFKTPVSDIEFTRWNELPENWTGGSIQIPSMMDFKKDRFTIYNPECCKVQGNKSSFIACKGLESDIISIQSNSLAYEYLLVSKDLYVRGLEGSVKRNVLLKRMVGHDKIRSILMDLISESDITDISEFSRIREYLSIIDDNEYTCSVIKKHLEGCRDIVSSLSEIKNMKGLKIDLGTIAEEVMAQSGLSIPEQVDKLSKAGIRVEGTVLASNIVHGSETSRISDVDAVLTVSRNKMGVLKSAGAETLVRKIVMEGEDAPFKSELAKAVDAHENMVKLMGYLDMTDLKHTNFDLDVMRDTCAEDFPKIKSLLQTEVNALSALIDKEGSMELNSYLEFFEDISQSLKLDVPLEKAKGRLSGVLMGTELEKNLHSLGVDGRLKEMIDQAFSDGLISETDRDVLDKIREFRNECAHSKQITLMPDDNTRQYWIKVIKSLDPLNETEKGKTENKKKAGKK